MDADVQSTQQPFKRPRLSAQDDRASDMASDRASEALPIYAVRQSAARLQGRPSSSDEISTFVRDVVSKLTALQEVAQTLEVDLHQARNEAEAYRRIAANHAEEIRLNTAMLQAMTDAETKLKEERVESSEIIEAKNNRIAELEERNTESQRGIADFERRVQATAALEVEQLRREHEESKRATETQIERAESTIRALLDRLDEKTKHLEVFHRQQHEKAMDVTKEYDLLDALMEPMRASPVWEFLEVGVPKFNEVTKLMQAVQGTIPCFQQASADVLDQCGLLKKTITALHEPPVKPQTIGTGSEEQSHTDQPTINGGV